MEKSIDLLASELKAIVLGGYTFALPDRASLEKFTAEAIENLPAGNERITTLYLCQKIGSWIEKNSVAALSHWHNEDKLPPINEESILDFITTKKYCHSFRQANLLRSLLTEEFLEQILPKYLGDFPDCVTKTIRVNQGELSFFKHLTSYALSRNEIITYTKFLLDLLPEEVETVPLSLIDSALLFAMDEVLKSEKSDLELLGEEISSQVPYIWTERRKVETELEHNPVVGQASLQRFERLSEAEKAIASIRQERNISDYTRDTLIPGLNAEQVSLRDSYWRIHRARFERQPVHAQNFGLTPFVVSKYTKNGVALDLYKSNIGTTRHLDVCCGDSFYHLPAGHLPVLEEVLFIYLEMAADRKIKPDTDTALNTIAISHATLAVLHLPFDGSGRTDEDFLIQFSERLGVKSTISECGYRHLVSPLVQEMEKALIRFKYEFDIYALRDMRISPENFNEHNWASSLRDLLSSWHRRAPAAHLVRKSLDAEDMIELIRKGNAGYRELAARYPALEKIREIWKKGMQCTYNLTPIAWQNYIEDLIAQSLITAPYKFKLSLHSELPHLNKFAVGRLFAAEHLERRTQRFVSEKLENHFDELYRTLKDS